MITQTLEHLRTLPKYPKLSKESQKEITNAVFITLTGEFRKAIELLDDEQKDVLRYMLENVDYLPISVNF